MHGLANGFQARKEKERPPEILHPGHRALTCDDGTIHLLDQIRRRQMFIWQCLLWCVYVSDAAAACRWCPQAQAAREGEMEGDRGREEEEEEEEEKREGPPQ